MNPLWIIVACLVLVIIFLSLIHEALSDIREVLENRP